LISPTIILAGLLALSVLGNLAQYKSGQAVREQLGAMRSERDAAMTAATSCSAGVADLERQASERDREAVRARTKADQVARSHEARAQQILAAAPAVPGDDCKSAGVAIDAWLQGRGKP
jgi:hypothetical protein